jgi:hypothetical protein
MDKIEYVLLVVGGVTWIAIVCWVIYYITQLDKDQDYYQKHDTHYRDGDNT